MSRTCKEVAAAVLIAAAVIILPLFLSNQRTPTPGDSNASGRPDHQAAVSRKDVKSTKVRKDNSSYSMPETAPDVDRPVVEIEEPVDDLEQEFAALSGRPDAIAFYRSLSAEHQQEFVQQLRERRARREQNKERFDLDKMANAIGLDIRNFTDSELEEIKSLLADGRVEDAASYAGIDLSKLSADELNALSSAMNQAAPRGPDSLPSGPSAPPVDPYSELRNSSLSAADSEEYQLEKAERAEAYLDVVATMNEGRIPAAAPTELSGTLSGEDPYQRLRESEYSGSEEESAARAEEYIRQAAESSERAKPN